METLSTLKERATPSVRRPPRHAAAWMADAEAPIRVRHRTASYHLMLLPAVAFLAVFSLYPLAGSVLAFKTYLQMKGIWGSPWAGFENFTIVFSSPHFYRILRNTVLISLAKMALGLAVPLAFTLTLNEVRHSWFRRGVQTITYMPYFLSWVILAGVFKDMFSTSGLVNRLLELAFGIKPVMFFANVTAFPIIVVLTDTWKDFGFNAILYLAAL